MTMRGVLLEPPYFRYLRISKVAEFAIFVSGVRPAGAYRGWMSAHWKTTAVLAAASTRVHPRPKPLEASVTIAVVPVRFG
jgi:hypothetical protein